MNAKQCPDCKERLQKHPLGGTYRRCPKCKRIYHESVAKDFPDAPRKKSALKGEEP